MEHSKNLLTYEGLRHILDVIMGISSVVNPWYVGIYTSYSGSILDLKGTDIGGNLVEFTNYTGSRPTYADVRTGQTISNVLSKAEFPILGAATIAGAFLTSDNSGPAGTLLSVDSFTSGSRTVGIGDTLRVTYELTSANG
jgi:hypothetical protein